MRFSMTVFSKDFEDGENMLYQYSDNNDECYETDIEMTYEEAVEDWREDIQSEIESLTKKLSDPDIDSKKKISNEKRLKELTDSLARADISEENEMEEVKEYYGEENFDEDDNLVTISNPDGKYAYSSIGCSSEGFLDLKAGGTSDTAYAKEIVYEPNARAGEIAAAIYDYLIDGIAIPENLKQTIRTQYGDISKKNGLTDSLRRDIQEQNNDRDEYIRSRMFNYTYGFISPDGEWHEMGYSNTCDWKYEFAQQMEEAIKNNYFISVYVCHI